MRRCCLVSCCLLLGFLFLLLPAGGSAKVLRIKSRRRGPKNRRRGSKSRRRGSKSRRRDSKSSRRGSKSKGRGSKSRRRNSKSRRRGSKSRRRGSKSRLLVGRRPPTCVPNALLDSCVLPFAMLLARVPKCAHLLSLDPCLRGGPRPTNSSAAPPWDSSGSPEILAETRAAVSRMQSHAGRGQVLAAKRKRPVRDQLKKARQRVNWSTRTLEWVGKFLGPQGRRITRLL